MHPLFPESSSVPLTHKNIIPGERQNKTSSPDAVPDRLCRLWQYCTDGGFDIGARYRFADRITLEAGWRHEEVSLYNNTVWAAPVVPGHNWDNRRVKTVGAVVYMHLGFGF